MKAAIIRFTLIAPEEKQRQFRAIEIREDLVAILKRAGHETCLSVVDCFPIADTLAERLSFAGSNFDAVVVLISQVTNEAHWVLREVGVQRSMIDGGKGRGMFMLLFMGEAQVPEWMPSESYVDFRRFATKDEAYAQLLSSIACAQQVIQPDRE